MHLPTTAIPFKYVRPDTGDGRGKRVANMIRTRELVCNVQVIGHGGETNLHSHPHLDGVWYVLSGRAKFYGPTNDEVICDLGPHEGIVIPHGYPYWFESSSDELLEILQIEAWDRQGSPDIPVEKDRIDFTPRTVFAVKDT